MSNENNSISIARGLVELKSLGGRIERAGNLAVVGVVIGSGAFAKPVDAAFATVELAKGQFVSNFDSIQGLIKRRESVKRAIVKANAATTVTIDGKTYSLAEAIEMKKFVSVRKTFLTRIAAQLRSAAATAGSHQTSLNTRIDTYRREQGESANAELVTASIEDMRKRGEPSILAPTDLNKFISEEMANIEKFEQEVDVALNETNAATQMEVVVE